ncbi:putative spindle poison sensitivity protein scp3 [Erysiphe neolycopersici]|uniref:Putative spindle poison sensitivity protein scp3 n=1 Tax=Erysiphe neolycopersici TaxID=212602 RepID=A0A420HE94_9PEZI|nr:putative spindle poison sensitivity protein scp3 [Erysiphe neolycopersici]
MEYRHMSTGSLNIPPPQTINAALSLKNSGAPWATATMTRFEGPRSPPGRQNTSHVPCKFFRAGACQAGNSCPFSHDPASTTDNICKYFAKGNCRFGPKCANVHVLPDGRRVNYAKSMGSSGGTGGIGGGSSGHLNIGGQVGMDYYHSPKSVPHLSNSLLCAYVKPSSSYGYQKFIGYREGSHSPRRKSSFDITIPSSDVGYTTSSANRTDEKMRRYCLGSSWPGKLPNILDAQMPNSFDTNIISWGGMQGSVSTPAPFNIGLDAPSDSSGTRDSRSSDTLKNLRNSVFGDEPQERFQDQVASLPINISDDYLGVRTKQTPGPIKMKPVSVNVTSAVEQDWVASFTFEEDYLPETLKDLMTPQEKARRGSRNADDESRYFHNGNGVQCNENSSEIGSPSNSSPSRWGSLFQRQQQKEEEDRARVSPFNHIGSPLRKTSLHPIPSPKAGPIARPNTTKDSPRRSSTSIITQQLHRTQISEKELNSENLDPTTIALKHYSTYRIPAIQK